MVQVPSTATGQVDRRGVPPASTRVSVPSIALWFFTIGNESRVMTERGPHSADDDNIDGSATESVLHGLASGLVGAVGGDRKAKELDATVESLAGEGVSGREVDALVSSALAVGASRAEIRRALRANRKRVAADAGRKAAVARSAGDDATAAEHGRTQSREPLVHVREVESESGGVVGVRVFVDASPASVEVFRGGQSVLVRTPGGALEQPLGFEPGPVEPAGDGAGDIAEYLIRPAEPLTAPTDGVPTDDEEDAPAGPPAGGRPADAVDADADADAEDPGAA